MLMLTLNASAVRSVMVFRFESNLCALDSLSAQLRRICVVGLVDFADLGVDRVFAWLKGLGPFLPCAHDLRVDVGVARVESVFPDEARDNCAFANFHLDHRHCLDRSKPWVDGIVSCAKHRDLKALLPASRKKCS